MPRKTDREQVVPRATVDSRERLIRAAQELLAERGLTGFKVLEVAARAEANVALINYYFGGRDGLLDEMVRDQAEKIALKRSRLLDAMLARAGSTPLDARKVLQCWIDPWLEQMECETNRHVMQLMLHLMFAADVERERKEHLLGSAAEITGRFVQVLCSCFPRITREQMSWRMLCGIGACYLVLGQREPIRWKTLAGRPGAKALASRRKELVGFILAGISAP